jgi:hypothetical protein
MKPIFLIVLALVFPLFWGYLAEQILRRIWPRRSQESKANEDRQIVKQEPQTPFLDYQI